MKGIVRFLVRMLVLNLVLVPIMVLGLAVLRDSALLHCSRIPKKLLGLAQLYFWLGPLSCAFWMLVSCHWPTVRRARLEGRLSTWRETEGGIVCTVAKATLYMFAGLFGSFVFEIALAFLFFSFSEASHTGSFCGLCFCP